MVNRDSKRDVKMLRCRTYFFVGVRFNLSLMMDPSRLNGLAPVLGALASFFFGVDGVSAVLTLVAGGVGGSGIGAFPPSKPITKIHFFYFHYHFKHFHGMDKNCIK